MEARLLECCSKWNCFCWLKKADNNLDLKNEYYKIIKTQLAKIMHIDHP